jgi:hypothetical protein
MDDFKTAAQLLAQVTRTLQLLNFRLMQLRHTNDQLLAGLQDLVARAILIDQTKPDCGIVNCQRDAEPRRVLAV